MAGNIEEAVPQSGNSPPYLDDLTGRADLEKELRQVTSDHKKLVDAIIAGIPADQVKDRMIDLDTRRKEIETRLSVAPAPDPLRFHPSMARTYRDRVGTLIRGLSDADGMEEAKEALRALVEKIVLLPDPVGDGLVIDLHGALAGLLRLATGQPLHHVAGRQNAKKASGVSHETFDRIEELVLVAGTGNRRSLRNGSGQQKTSSAGASEVSQVSLVAGACNKRYLRLVERQIPKFAA